MSDSLWPHGLQHTRLPYPSPTPGVCLNSCPSSRWCHPTISSSVVPFSSCLQSFPASGAFQMSQLFASGGQSIGVSASTSASTFQWTLRADQLSLWSIFHIHTWLLEKPQLWLYEPLSAKWCLCFFNMLSRFFILSSKEQVPFNFMATAAIHRNFADNSFYKTSSFQS